MTICTVHVHDFFAPKLDWNLTNLGRMCWIPGKTDKKNAGALLLSFLLHAPTSPDRFWKWPWSTAMCMAMQIFGLVSLKRWLPMNHRELPEFLEIEFEAILPGRKQRDFQKISYCWEWFLLRFHWHHLVWSCFVARQISSYTKQSSCWNTWLYWGWMSFPMSLHCSKKRSSFGSIAAIHWRKFIQKFDIKNERNDTVEV